MRDLERDQSLLGRGSGIFRLLRKNCLHLPWGNPSGVKEGGSIGQKE